MRTWIAFSKPYFFIPTNRSAHGVESSVETEESETAEASSLRSDDDELASLSPCRESAEAPSALPGNLPDVSCPRFAPTSRKSLYSFVAFCVNRYIFVRVSTIESRKWVNLAVMDFGKLLCSSAPSRASGIVRSTGCTCSTGEPMQCSFSIDIYPKCYKLGIFECI